ncbi:MAG: L-alanine exporter AlaE [Nitrososphaerales archaeon]
MTEIRQHIKTRKYVIDSLASIAFWVPIYLVFNTFILHLEIWQVLALAAFSAMVNFAFGGLFGRFLDWWRKKLTNHYV